MILVFLPNHKADMIGKNNSCSFCFIIVITIWKTSLFLVVISRAFEEMKPFNMTVSLEQT